MGRPPAGASPAPVRQVGEAERLFYLLFDLAQVRHLKPQHLNTGAKSSGAFGQPEIDGAVGEIDRGAGCSFAAADFFHGEKKFAEVRQVLGIGGSDADVPHSRILRFLFGKEWHVESSAILTAMPDGRGNHHRMAQKFAVTPEDVLNP